jgi:hypothetical protein
VGHFSNFFDAPSHRAKVCSPAAQSNAGTFELLRGEALLTERWCYFQFFRWGIVNGDLHNAQSSP